MKQKRQSQWKEFKVAKHINQRCLLSKTVVTLLIQHSCSVNKQVNFYCYPEVVAGKRSEISGVSTESLLLHYWIRKEHLELFCDFR